MADPIQEDIEKTSALKTSKSSDNFSPVRPNNDGYDKESQMRRGSITKHHEGFFTAFTLDSFKRNPNARVVTEATDLEGRPLPDQPPAEPALAMRLKERHLQMIAIGGSIGSSSLISFSPKYVPRRSLSYVMLDENWANEHKLIDFFKHRHRSLRRFWLGSRNRWSCISDHCIWTHWYDALLYCPRFGRTGCRFPYRWCILRLLK